MIEKAHHREAHIVSVSSEKIYMSGEICSEKGNMGGSQF